MMFRSEELQICSSVPFPLRHPKRILALLEEIRRTPFEGAGKPEPLRSQLAGCWSRRIDREHRLVYQVEENEIILLACRYHC